MFHSKRISVADYHKVDDMHIAEEVCRCFDKNKDNYTDFTVNVGDTKFNCHKFVLSSCSGFFEALIRTDMREKSESSCTIEGISPEIFGLILDSIYKGKDVLDTENMLDMWHASNQLQIKFLVSLCETFVKERVNLQNYWEIFTDAKLLDSINVTTRVKEFMVNNFETIVESNDFMQLSYDDLKYLLNHSWSISADIIVESVLKWTYADDLYLLHEPKNCIKAPNTVSDNCHLKSICRKGNISRSDKFMEAFRRTHLARLLALVPLEGASDECLNKLMNNKFVSANVYAITRVNKVVAARFTLEKKLKPNKMLVKDVKSNSVLPQASHDDDLDYITQLLLKFPYTIYDITEEQPIVNKVAATRFSDAETNEYNFDTLIKRNKLLIKNLNLKLDSPSSRSEVACVVSPRHLSSSTFSSNGIKKEQPKSSDGHYQTAVKLMKSVGRLTLSGLKFGFNGLFLFLIAFLVLCLIKIVAIIVCCPPCSL